MSLVLAMLEVIIALVLAVVILYVAGYMSLALICIACDFGDLIRKKVKGMVSREG